MLPFIKCPLATFKEQFPEGIALIDKERSYTALELDKLVQGTCLELVSLGIKQEDRVAFMGHSCLKTILLLLALMRLHAVACPLNIRNPSLHLEKLASKWIDIETFPLKEGIYEENLIDQEKIATLLFTSGSTASPKIAALSFNNHYYSALGSIEKTFLKEADSWQLSLPLFHVAGMGIVFRCLLGAATIVLSSTPTTHLSLIPTQLFRLLKTKHHLKAKCILLGGAPIPSSLFDEAIKQGLNIFPTYGMTEMGSSITLNTETVFSLGKTLPFREIKIGDNGEILVKGKTLFKGYWNQEEGLKSPLDKEGFFPTKDRGVLSSTGNLSFIGRMDNLFISGGENIQPEEIENALCSIPEIESAIVVGVEDAEFGKRPLAFIQGNTCLETIKEALSPLLPKYKIPFQILPLPQEELLKPSRKRLTLLAQALVKHSKGAEE